MLIFKFDEKKTTLSAIHKFHKYIYIYIIYSYYIFDFN